MNDDLVPAVASVVVLLGQSGVLAPASSPVHFPLSPRTLPVCSWLDVALVQAPDLARGVCDGLRSVALRLHWRQNASYAGAPFLDRYGYCELAGPDGHLRDDRKSLGILLLGPATEYPAHAHPARETYLILSGHAWWKVGAGDWALRSAGDVIRHPSGVAHAMRTDAAPLLAAYLWEDHLDVPARLTSAEDQTP